MEIRIAAHTQGVYGGYTYNKRPVTLVFSQYFDQLTDAIAAERQIKGWSRAKKETIIAQRFDLLAELASRPTARKLNTPPS